MRVRLLAGPYGKAWFAVLLLASAHVILTNEQDAWRFLHQRLRYPVSASRYSIIPVGSNLPVVIPSERSPATNQVTIGYFGFVNPAKGVDTLLDAFALARQQRPDLRLTLICALRPHDPYHQMLLRKLEDEALRDAVTLTGELDADEAARTLAGCNLIVLPFRDGVSLRRTTLMAALALGRPVISTRALHSEDKRYFRLEWDHAVETSSMLRRTARYIHPVVIDDTPYDDPDVPLKFGEYSWEHLTQEGPSDAWVETIRQTVRSSRKETPA